MSPMRGATVTEYVTVLHKSSYHFFANYVKVSVATESVVLIPLVSYHPSLNPSKLPYKYRGVFSSKISGLNCCQLARGQYYILVVT